LSYDKGNFYLVYSNVKSFDGVWKDTPNFLVTSNDITGNWSAPIYLNSSGFDGSLFHDDDGRKYFVSMITDQRRGRLFGGIVLQEYCNKAKKLIGKQQLIFEGSALGCTEAPHIYKRNGYYYLITAEGGTGYHHAVTMARSKNILGEYELHPENPIISAANFPTNPLQKTGHGDLIDTPQGDWFCVFLASRPLTERGRCTLGRETAIEAMQWREDDWIYAANNGLPRLQIPTNLPTASTKESTTIRDDFDTPTLDIHFQSLRIPINENWLSLSARKGFLRLYGQESLSSLHHQSLIARRVQHFHIEASTCVEFEPTTYQQMSGLVCYYNTTHFHYLYLLGDLDSKQKFLNIISYDKGTPTELQQYIDVTGVKKVFLKAVFDHAVIQFYYGTAANKWIKIGQPLDGSILSDDYVSDDNGRYRPAFTGAFVGLCCQDLSGQRQYADFDFFEYQEFY
jgi:xylan 1,4-beta-xylosidase